MRAYKTDRAIVNGWLSKPEPGQDTSRSHAANWAAGVALLSFCVYVIGWCCAKVLWAYLPNWSIILCVPVSLLCGLIYGGFKLISYTEEHRDWLYAIEEKTGKDFNRDNVVGKPIMAVGELPESCMIRGIDGQLKRINARLTKADIHAVKTSLLVNGTFGVRAINSLLGDETRASGLRLELHRLGILEQPQPRQATRLTNAGLRAVRRWA